MDAGNKGKKKNGGKADFENAIKGNEEIRNMRWHIMNFDELEDALDTDIAESKCSYSKEGNLFHKRSHIYVFRATSLLLE